MNCDDYRELLTPHLCGELEDDSQKEMLQQHLEVCEGCKQTHSEFRSILGIMHRLPAKEWDEKLTIRDLLRRNRRWSTFVFSKAAIWLLALTAAITVVMYIPLRWELSANQFSLSWGKSPSHEQSLAREMKNVQKQLAVIQQQNQDFRESSETRIKSLLEQNNMEQQKRYWQTLELFTKYLQLEHKADVQKIQHDIAATYDRTGQEVQKTNELLEYVLRTSATNNAYPNE
jgi:hypothetical protein